MPGISLEDLSPEVQKIIDTEAWDGACMADQPVCEADPRVTAQLRGGDPTPREQMLPWRIANASAGDLIMSPGGPAGLIGGLLSQLDPPHVFSHMAIMVSDEVELRHVTASEDRIHQFYDGSILGIEKVPTDGIKERALRYQWPGTVTQTVEQAYLSWRDHPNEKDAQGEPIKDANGVTVPLPGFGFLDTETGSSYHIDALSFAPVPQKDGSLVWPLVVTSCPELTTTAVERARRRLANIARDVRGHYRLYAYTRGDIAMDTGFDGPPGYETTVRDPSCTGSLGTVPLERTRAMMCSTFPWTVVQIANELAAAASPPLPQIVVDGRPRNPHLEGKLAEGCQATAFRRPRTMIDRMEPQTPDGMYYFDEAARQRAAQWLHDHMVEDVLGEIDAKMPNVWRDLGVVGGLGVSALIALLTALPLTTVAVMLGVTPTVLAQLVVLTSDMPDDVANQLCNAFANDDCSQASTDSEAWRAPGEGRSAGPDNIVNSWAPPTVANSEVIHGLYGWNDRIRMRPPELAHFQAPQSTWQISQGFGSVEGYVFYRDENGNSVGVAGARIRIGCRHFASDAGGSFFDDDLPSGHYWCVARYTHPVTGLVMESEGQAVEILDGGGISLPLELMPPPDTRREVLITGHMDLVNRYAIGKDWWDHPRFTIGPRYLGLDYWPPNNPAYEAQRLASLAQTDDTTKRVDDWGDAQLECDLRSEDDRSITVNWRARLKNDPDDPWQKTGTFSVPPRTSPAEPPVHVAIDLVRSEMAWPVRAHIEFDVFNDTAP